MKGLQFGLIVAVLVVASGCGLRFGKSQVDAELGSIVPLSSEPSENSYRYAYSAIIKSNQDGESIEQFSVDIVAEDKAVKNIINALGNKKGVFHISRNPSETDSSESYLPVLVSSPGYESQLQWIQVGKDCLKGKCVSTKPETIYLRPKSVQSNPFQSNNLSPRAATQRMAAQGTRNLFQRLSDSGKLDSKIQNQLARATNSDKIENVVVMLENPSQTSGELENLVGSLLNGSNASSSQQQNITNLLNGLSGSQGSGPNINSLMGLFASGSPEIAAALLAIQFLTPYVQDIVARIQQNRNGPIINLIAAFVNNDQLPNLLAGIISGQLQGNQIWASLIPFLGGMINSDTGSSASSLGNISNPSIPFGGILGRIFRGNSQNGLFGRLFGRFNSPSPSVPQGNMNEIAEYLQPLIQGLMGSERADLSELFNQLITGADDPLNMLNNIAEQYSALGRDGFYKLLPYLQPITQGLQSEKGKKLADFLIPLLNQENPAMALSNLFENPDQNNLFESVAPAMFPSLGRVIKENTPAKQVFAAQILQGLVNGDFKGTGITRDLPSSSAVVISARARDLFKIAQLPNVKKLVAGK